MKLPSLLIIPILASTQQALACNEMEINDDRNVIVAYRTRDGINNGKVMYREGNTWYLDNKSGMYGLCNASGVNPSTGTPTHFQIQFAPGRKRVFVTGTPDSVSCRLLKEPPCNTQRYRD